MSEPTVSIPVSLLERAIHAAWIAKCMYKDSEALHVKAVLELLIIEMQGVLIERKVSEIGHVKLLCKEGSHD